MKINHLRNRSKELNTRKGEALIGLHLAVWDSIKDFKMPDQMWVLNGLHSSIKERQSIEYCPKCRRTNCKHNNKEKRQ